VPVPVDLNILLLTALLNPVVIVVAFWMGRDANQWQKLPLAAFAAAFAGSVAVYLAVRLGVPGIVETARAPAGIFVAQFVFALAWAAAGYRFARRSS
jgi:zinc transporter ZupT